MGASTFWNSSLYRTSLKIAQISSIRDVFCKMAFSINISSCLYNTHTTTRKTNYILHLKPTGLNAILLCLVSNSLKSSQVFRTPTNPLSCSSSDYVLVIKYDLKCRTGRTGCRKRNYAVNLKYMSLP